MTKSSRRPKENRRPRPATGTFGAFAHRPSAATRVAAIVRAATRARARARAAAAARPAAAASAACPIHLASPIRPASPVPTAEDEGEPWHSLSDSDDVRRHWSDGLPEDSRARPLVQHALALPVAREIPTTQLPDMTQRRLSYIDVTLVHERGELASPQCDYCSVALSANPGRKVPHFSACVVLDGWSSGGCTNCHWHNTNPRCSFRCKYKLVIEKECANNRTAPLNGRKKNSNNDDDNDVDNDDELRLTRRQALKMAQHHRGIADVLEEVAS